MAGEIDAKGNGYIGSHGIGHGGSAAGMTSSECHSRIRRKCMEKLAGFLKRLESVPEGGHRTIASFYLSLLHAVGDRKQNTFGIDDNGIKDLDQSGPLAEIMV